MALIGQHQQTTFVNPQAGQSPISAAVVRGNDNALVAKHNSHDSDATVHVQTGTFAGRPAFGTARAMYMDENARLYLDTGAAWLEVPYARLAAASSTFTGNVAVEGSLAVDGLTALNDNTTVTGTLDVSGALTAGSYSGIPQSAVTNLVSDLGGKAATSHTHAASAITSGTLDAARLPTIAFATAAGTAESLAVLTNTLKVDSAEAALLVADGAASWHTASAPGGSGDARYLNVTLGGTAYRIECKTVA